MKYPVEMTDDDNGTVLVTFPDVPGAITYGDDRPDALARAVDALETMLASYIIDRKDLPLASAANGRATVEPSLLAALKLAIYQAMRAKDWRKADLARALAVNPRQVDRLLDLSHASPLSQIDAAMAAMGRAVRIEIEAIAA